MLTSILFFSSAIPETLSGVYSQKSFKHPIYPFVPIEKPTPHDPAVPPKSVFCIQIFAAGSYSQKSFVLYGEVLWVPVPIYPFIQIEKPTATSLAVPPKSAFCVQMLLD